MTREEARTLLEAATFIPPDETDADLRAALRMTESDAELRAWFEDRKAFDAKMSAALADAPPPAALRGRLLAAMNEQRIVRPRFSAWRTLAIAASLALLGAVTVLIYQRSASSPDWKSDALAVVRQLDGGTMPLDEKSPKLPELKAWLANANAPTAQSLPSPLSLLTSLGCKQVNIAGHPASIICFHLPGSDKLAHLVVVENTDAKAKGPTFQSSGKWRFATWNENGKVMMLATRASEETLRKLFA